MHAHKLLAFALALLLLNACAIARTEAAVRIALLAPFEGRYRDAGYEALYAAQLALRERGSTRLELLPVDDGGTVASAASRAKALVLDPQVMAVVALGYEATSTATLEALVAVPVVVAGHWGATPNDSTFILANRETVTRITTPARVPILTVTALEAPVTGSDVLSMEQFTELRRDLDDVYVVSSGHLPDEAFAQRYAQGNPFAPTPGLLATLTYDAAALAADAVLAQPTPTRNTTLRLIAAADYVGYNGRIRFDGSYWLDAPIRLYRFDETGRLAAADDIVE